MDLFAHNVHVLDRKEDNSLVPVKVRDADEEQDICPSVTTGCFKITKSAASIVFK